MISTLLDRIGNWNPQLFRELKGRLKPKNLAIAAGISAVVQGLVFLVYQSQLPDRHYDFNRYCQGMVPPNWDGYKGHSYYQEFQFCTKDALGYITPETINWNLWWLDLFTAMSIIGIFLLLIVGTYMLISDLSQEERRGTLNFIRLSPQSTANILVGKLLGVPALLYLFGLLALPLHLGAGFAAHIPPFLILGFYTVLAASCAFFYSAALLYGLVSAGLGTFQAWVGSGALLAFLWFFTWVTLSQGDDTISFSPLDWFTLFYPGSVLPYLVSSTPHSLDTIDYLNVKDFAQLTWFDWTLFHRAKTAIAFELANYGIWTYWVWQGLQRRFHNAHTTVLGKGQSYLISASIAFVTLGFTMQRRPWGGYSDNLFDNTMALLIVMLVLCLGLIAALSPHRPTLQDWARYRHQMAGESRNLLKDLIWGEKSPATVAIALNVIIALSFVLVFAAIMPFGKLRTPTLLGLVSTGTICLIYASLAQWMLMFKTQKRAAWATVAVVALVVMPFTCFAIFGVDPYEGSWLWLFSAVPIAVTEHLKLSMAGVFSIWLVQGLAIALINVVFAKQLHQVGESEAKALLASRR